MSHPPGSPTDGYQFIHSMQCKFCIFVLTLVLSNFRSALLDRLVCSTQFLIHLTQRGRLFYYPLGMDLTYKSFLCCSRTEYDDDLGILLTKPDIDFKNDLKSSQNIQQRNILSSQVNSDEAPTGQPHAAGVYTSGQRKHARQEHRRSMMGYTSSNPGSSLAAAEENSRADLTLCRASALVC
jgi:hypothetical protein